MLMTVVLIQISYCCKEHMFALLHVPKTGGTAYCRQRCASLYCDVHHRKESYWQAKKCVKQTIAFLRNPVDRFVSAFNYAKYGTKDDVENVSGHNRVLFIPFKNVSHFVSSLRQRDKRAWTALRKREGGRQFAKATTFMDGNYARRKLICYDVKKGMIILQNLTGCIMKNEIYWQSSHRSYLTKAEDIAFIQKMYKEDMKLFSSRCNVSYVPTGRIRSFENHILA
jgi:hypothetical protein